MKDRFIAPRYMRPALTTLASLAGDLGIEAYVVGGSVRDVLLQRLPVDLDLAVNHDAFAFARRAAETLGGHYVELDDERSVARVVLKSHVVAQFVCNDDVERDDQLDN